MNRFLFVFVHRYRLPKRAVKELGLSTPVRTPHGRHMSIIAAAIEVVIPMLPKEPVESIVAEQQIVAVPANFQSIAGCRANDVEAGNIQGCMPIDRNILRLDSRPFLT